MVIFFKILNEFVGKHPNLESLSVEYYKGFIGPQVQVPTWILPSLKVLNYSRLGFHAGMNLKSKFRDFFLFILKIQIYKQELLNHW